MPEEGPESFSQIEDTMEKLRTRSIFFGASITVTTENVSAVMEERFLHKLSQYGCKVIFFIEYVPVTQETESLAPTQETRDYMEQQLAVLRPQNSEMILLFLSGRMNIIPADVWRREEASFTLTRTAAQSLAHSLRFLISMSGITLSLRSLIPGFSEN